MPRIVIPTALREKVGGATEVSVKGKTVREAVEQLEKEYPKVAGEILREGKLKAGLAVAVDGTIRAQGLYEKVKTDSEIQFLPAIGGG